MSAIQPRRPAGIPTGGQFAAKAHPEPGFGLEPDEGLAGRPADGALGDVANVREGSRTPWGTAQWVAHTAPGAVQVSTAGHGGIKLSPERNKMIPPALRNSSGWYEEDCEAGIVAWIHPDACPQKGRFPEYDHTPEQVSESGRQTTLNWFPDAYEKATGETLAVGQSFKRDQDLWRSAHAGDEVAVSATRSTTFADFTEVTVRRGGTCGEASTERVLLVPSDEYNDPANRHPLGKADGRFVVDPARRYADITLPPAPPKPPRARYRAIDASRLSAAQQRRVGADLAVRVRCADGEVRTVAEIVEAGMIVGKASTSPDVRGRRQFYLRMAAEAEGEPGDATTYALSVSKATWDAMAAPTS